MKEKQEGGKLTRRMIGIKSKEKGRMLIKETQKIEDTGKKKNGKTRENERERDKYTIKDRKRKEVEENT